MNTASGWILLGVLLGLVGLRSFVKSRRNPEFEDLYDITLRFVGAKSQLCPVTREIMALRYQGRKLTPKVVAHMGRCEFCKDFDESADQVMEQETGVRQAKRVAICAMAESYDSYDQLIAERDCSECDDLTVWHVLHNCPLTPQEQQHRADCWFCRWLGQVLVAESEYVQPRAMQAQGADTPLSEAPVGI